MAEEKALGWHKVGFGFSVQKLKTTYNIRNDKTGEVVRPAGQAGRDNLMMALHKGMFPSYAHHAFGPEAVKHVPARHVY